jgi:hypothetical protein
MSSDIAEQTDGPPKKNWKVGRIIEKYDLDGLDEELIERWTGENRDQYSLRDLAEYFNVALLREAKQRAGIRSHAEELDYQYRMLTDKSVTSGMRTEVIRELERGGVDYDRLERDFVTHQAIYTYLTDYHGIEYDSNSGDQVTKDLETINQLQSRTRAVIEGTVRRLDNTDRISIGDQHVLLNVRIMCHDCGGSYSVTELLESGSCDCEDE